MIFRQGTNADISGFLSLQERNLLGNLNAYQMKKGFVTTPFSSSQLETLIAEGTLFIADEGGIVAGYAVGASWDFLSQWPIFPFLLNRLHDLTFMNMPLAKDRCFEYGPVCIDETYRGSGAFQNLFEVLRSAMCTRYSTGLTFINKMNTVSFAAHTKKLKFSVIDEFSFNEKEFYLLAFDASRSVL